MSSLVEKLIKGKSSEAGLVPRAKGHVKRHPFLLLIDTSGSTGIGGAHADIHQINRMTSELCDRLKNPAPSSPLADKGPYIDLSIVNYSNEPYMATDWSLLENVPVSFNFTPMQGTATARALGFALDHIRQRLEYYTANNISYSMPQIFHITDGAPTDFAIGTPSWDNLKQRLAPLDGSNNPEVVLANILHFISSSGCTIQSWAPKNADGKDITGQELYALLSKPTAVFELTDSPEAIESLISFITLVITSMSVFGKSPTDAAREALGTAHTGIKPTAPSAPGTIY